MSYLGSTPTTQNFIAGTDSFNGTGSATNFTLSRIVNSVNDIQVVVNNVVQYPPNYSVSGTTLTISPAPSSGTNNVYVRYLSTTLQSITVPGGSSVNGTFQVTQDTYLATTSGNVGIGTSSPVNVLTVQTAATGTTAGSNVIARFQSNASGRDATIQLSDNVANSSTVSMLSGATVFRQNGTESMRIDSSGNVGIGTSSPNYKLNVGSTSAVTSLSGTGLTLFTTGSLTSSVGGVLNFRPGLGTTTSDIYNLSICAYDHSGDTNADGLSINGYDGVSFCTGSSSRQERARIDSSGNFILTAAGNINLNIFNTQSLAQSGYQKFPNGLIIQWGRVTFGGTSATVTFPIAFPNAFWGIAGIPKYGSAISIAFNGESTSGLTLRTSINTGDYFPYIAVGY